MIMRPKQRTEKLKFKLDMKDDMTKEMHIISKVNNNKRSEPIQKLIIIKIDATIFSYHISNAHLHQV